MNAEELRRLQSGIKQRYKATPQAAHVVSRAEARVEPERLICLVKSFRGETVAGLHPATGGDGASVCSADMLLEALIACAGVTMSAVATAMGIALRSARIVAEGVWNARGTLAVDRTVPVGLTEIRLDIELDTDAPPAALARLIESTERYCVIYQTLCSSPRLELSFRRGGEPAS